MPERKLTEKRTALKNDRKWNGEKKERELEEVPWGGRGATPATDINIYHTPIFDGLHMMSGSHLKEGHATSITAVNTVIEEADRWRSGIITCAAPSHVSFMGRG